MFNKYTKRDVWFSACIICVFEVFADTWAAESNACGVSCRYGRDVVLKYYYTNDCHGGRGSPTWTRGPCT